MSIVLLFVLGTALGSFLNVLADRYDPDRFLLKGSSWRGRSRCPHCARVLGVFDLIPLVSFLVLSGRCRTCGAKLSPQYPIAEFLAGAIVASVPLRTGMLFVLFPGLDPFRAILLEGVMTLAFLALLLMALIDWRLQLIPDEINIFLSLLGVAAAFIASPGFGLAGGSFMGSYALLFGFRDHVLLNHLLGGLLGAAFLGALFLLTRGRGIGLGDVKLSFALGLIFGWPDVLFIQVLAFVIGSVYGILKIARGESGLKSFVAFGPFLALASVIVYFRGYELLAGYFRLFNIW